MPKQIKLLGISGSIRTTSTNTGLLRAFCRLSEEFNTEMSILSYDDIPFYNQDVEDQGNPESVDRVRQLIQDSDAIIFACPEYNGFFSASLKNLIDWGTRKKNVWSLKYCSIVSTGGTFGGLRASKHLSELLKNINMQVVEDQGVHLNIFKPPIYFDKETGDLINESILKKTLISLLDYMNKESVPPETVK